MRFPARILTFSTLMLLLSSCAYVIPPERNAPRNNEVLGEPHRPQLNGMPPQSALTPNAAAPQMAQASMPPVLPPVDAQTKAMAEAQLPTAEFSVAPAANPMGERRVPLENQAFQVAAMGFDPITNVPERPATSGPDSVNERLSATQAILERDRTVAVESKNALARDAAAEPSMLSELPKADAAVAPADAVKVAPIAPLPTEAIPPAVTVPAPDKVRMPALNKPSSSIAPVKPMPVASAPMALPAEPVFAPPAPLGAMPVAHARPAAPEAVVATTAPAPVPLAMAIAVAPTKPAVVRGDFDPLAAADNAPMAAPVVATTASASRYAVNGYIAPSRYYTRRF